MVQAAAGSPPAPSPSKKEDTFSRLPVQGPTQETPLADEAFAGYRPGGEEFSDPDDLYAYHDTTSQSSGSYGGQYADAADTWEGGIILEHQQSTTPPGSFIWKENVTQSRPLPVLSPLSYLPDSTSQVPTYSIPGGMPSLEYGPVQTGGQNQGLLALLGPQQHSYARGGGPAIRPTAQVWESPMPDTYRQTFTTNIAKYQPELDTLVKENEYLKGALAYERKALLQERLSLDRERESHDRTRSTFTAQRTALGEEIASLREQLSTLAISSKEELGALRDALKVMTGKKEDAMTHLVLSNEAYNTIMAERCPPADLTFASRAVATLRKAFAECTRTRDKPSATMPQGWFSMDYLCLVPEGDCCVTVRPQQSDEPPKCCFNWRQIQKGFRAQLKALEYALSQVVDPPETSHPGLVWLIKVLGMEMPMEHVARPPRN
jgi:hypothetical protein